MKKFVSLLLVLTMVLAVASVAMAETLTHNMVELKCDSNAYTSAKSSAKTRSVAQKGSVGWCEKVCGKYAKVLVNPVGGTYTWFKKCDLKVCDKDANFVWAKGGKGMSSRLTRIYSKKSVFNGKIKVTGHTNLRRTPSLHCKSQGVVEECDRLKLTGRFAFDDRLVPWVEVCKDGRHLWLSTNFAQINAAQAEMFLKVLLA